MINCPKCNAEIEDDSFFCDQCGQEISYCSLCGRPGKGHRCTSCGGMMISGEEKMNRSTRTSVPGADIPLINTENQDTIRIPELYFSNETMHLRFAAIDGAIIGRRHGVYQEYFANASFVSGSHAQLNYSRGEGWFLTDLGSSNGTQVDGRQLRQGEPCLLLNGSRVRLANIEFNIELLQ